MCNGLQSFVVSQVCHNLLMSLDYLAQIMHKQIALLPSFVFPSYRFCFVASSLQPPTLVTMVFYHYCNEMAWTSLNLAKKKSKDNQF